MTTFIFSQCEGLLLKILDGFVFISKGSFAPLRTRPDSLCVVRTAASHFFGIKTLVLWYCIREAAWMILSNALFPMQQNCLKDMLERISDTQRL